MTDNPSIDAQGTQEEGSGMRAIRVINGGLKFGRTWVGFRRIPGYVPHRFGRRSGGQRTPGPWWEFMIPLVGSVIVNRDRSLFGFDDPVNDRRPSSSRG